MCWRPFWIFAFNKQMLKVSRLEPIGFGISTLELSRNHRKPSNKNKNKQHVKVVSHSDYLNFLAYMYLEAKLWNFYFTTAAILYGIIAAILDKTFPWTWNLLKIVLKDRPYLKTCIKTLHLTFKLVFKGKYGIKCKMSAISGAILYPAKLSKWITGAL